MEEEKEKIVNDFISRVNPYEKLKPLQFDMRGYAEYVQKHNIPANKITIDILKNFQEDYKKG